MVDEWKSAEARDKYMALYRSLRADWDGVRESDVETSIGPTRLFETDGEGDPIVLLHGANTNSFMWMSVLPHLAGRHVVLPDMPGEPGESELLTPVDSFAGLVGWVSDVIGDQRVHLVGASYGGVIATHFALAYPERLLSVTLVEPVLTKLLMAKFMAHGIVTGLAIAVPGPQRKVLAQALGVGDVVENDRLRKMGVMGFRSHTRKALPTPAPFSDAELASLKVPTTVLLGRHSSIHNARKTADYLRGVNPSLNVALISDGHHTLPVTHPGLIASAIPSR